MPVTECIAVYIRLSSEDNDVDGSIKAESNSVSAQRMLINEFIKKQDEFTNCPVVEYVDDGYSGTNFNRPGFQRMMEDAKAGRIKSIVIKDFSRFGRDYLDVGNYLEKILPVLGIRIISINDGFDSINSSGFTGGMSVALKNMLNAAKNMAQFISENLEKKKSEWHKTILKEENIATLESEKKRLSSRKMKLYSDYRSEVLDKEGYMEELEKTTSRISEITLQIIELENEIATAKKKCDEATEKEMEVNEIAALQDFDKIQLSKIIEKVFIYGPGRMEINWKMDDIFYKEEKA